MNAPKLLWASIVGLSLLATACGNEHAHDHGADSDHAHGSDHGHGHGHGQEMAVARGRHGGRLFQAGSLAMEVTLFEQGVPPEFRLYAYRDGEPLPPDQVQAVIVLTRLDGLPGDRLDEHRFEPRADYLWSEREVVEPHSFDAQLRVLHAGEVHEWRWSSHEGRTEIPSAMADANALRVAEAGPARILREQRLSGRIAVDATRRRAVRARFAGLVANVEVEEGDRVAAGQRLARIESNDSLQSYAVNSPIAGVVTRRSVQPGEVAGDGVLFEVVDFSRVWAEFSVFPQDAEGLQTGQTVDVRDAAGISAQARISLLSPLGDLPQSRLARVVLDNADGRWSPGQFVEARVAVGAHDAEVTVPLEALQGFRDWDVVFVQEGEAYQALPVELGLRDARRVEIRSGLAAGARVVVGNSYLVKADVEKSGASHDH